MTASTVTRKGQVTIPKPIRERLGVQEGEKVSFSMRGEEVVLRVLRGTILDLKGSIKPSARPEDFGVVRGVVKRSVAGRAARRG